MTITVCADLGAMQTAARAAVRRDSRRHLIDGMRPGRVARTLRDPHDHTRVWAQEGDVVLVGPADACSVVAFVSMQEGAVRSAWYADIEPLTEG